MTRSHVDLSCSPPVVTIPREYNAAADLLDRNVVDEGRGAKVAYIDDRTQLTYEALLARSQQVAALWTKLDVHREQRVLLVMQDTIDFPAVFLGAMRAGVVPIPINTLLTADDYAYMLRDSRARAVIVSDCLVPKIDAALALLIGAVGHHAPRPKIVVTATPQGGDAGAHPRLDALLGERDAVVADTTRDDIAFWLYSSGSTGAPKGALHLHSHLMQTSALYAQPILGLRSDDVVFSAAKLFFAYGLGNALTFPLSVGATTVLSAERATPANVMRIFREQRPTVFCGVPTLFASILAGADNVPAAGARLRISTSAGEALPRHTGEAWRARFGSDILDGIGSTEMLHIFLSNRPGDVRYGTTGFPVPGYDVELRDGVLWVRGPTACAGYWNQRERSLDTFEGRWMRTGDRYEKNEDGTFTYAGRDDDMLKVGGIWVAPFEVESALASHDAVLEAAVVGHKDDEGLVKPKAFVVRKPGAAVDADVLKAFVKEKLAPYKYPRWIEFVDELPKTATGKIQRFKLR